MKKIPFPALLFISFVTLIAGALWILFPSELAPLFNTNAEILSILREISVLIFIVIASLLYILLRASQRLSERQKRTFEDFFEIAPIGIIQWNLDGSPIRVNKVMADMHGYASVGEMLGAVSNISKQLFASPGSYETLLEVLKEHGTAEKFEVKNYKKDGSIFDISLQARAVKSQDGEIGYYEAFVTDITRKKDVESALRDKEKQYRTLIEQTPVAAYIDTMDGLVNFFSDLQIFEMSGYSREEWRDIPQLWQTIIHVEDRQRVQEESERTLKSGEAFNIEYRIIAKDDRVVWVHDVASLIVDESNSPLYWQGILVDVTREKEAEERLVTSEAQYRTAVEHASDGIIVISQAGRITEANQQMCKILGYSRNDLLELSFDDLFPAGDQFSWNVNELTRGRAVIAERPLSRKDGTLVLVELSIKSLPNNLLMGIARNISNRKLMEETLARSEKKFRALIENSMDAVALYSESGEILFQSPAASRILGYLVGEMIGKNALDFVHEEDKQKANKAIQKLVGHPSESILLTVRCVCKDGSIKWIEFNATNHLNEKDIEGIISNYRDVTERKIFENALFEAEERYRLLVENLPAVIFLDIFDDEQESQYISPRIQDLLGYTAPEWISTNDLWENSLHPDDKERVLAEDIRTNETNEPFRIEYRLRHRDGHYLWIKEDASIVKGEDGTPLFWQGVLLDITGQKQAEEALDRREAILRTVGISAEQFLRSADWEDSIEDVLAQLGRATNVSSVNIFKRELGARQEYAVSKIYEWRDAKEASRHHPTATPTMYLIKDGFKRWVELFNQDKPVFGNIREFPSDEQVSLQSRGILSLLCIPIYVEEADWWGFIGFDEFNTEREWSSVEIDALRAAAATLGASIRRRQSEEALVSSETSYRGLFNAVQDAIYIQDEAGRFMDVNDGVVRMCGYSRESLLGKTLEFLGVAGKNDTGKITEAVRFAHQGQPQQFEFWGQRSNGEIFPQDVRMFKGSYFGKEVIIAVAQDITARKQDEDALQKQFRELSILHLAALTESTSTDTDKLIQQITDIIGDSLYSDNCGVLLLNEEQNTLTPHFSYRGTDTENIGVSLPITKGITGKAVSTRRPVRVADVSRDPAYFEVTQNTRSELCVPIISGSKIFGVLNVESKIADAFTERDERLLNTIAGGVANALERIQLFEAEKKRRVEAEILREATLDLTFNFELDKLFETIFNSVAKLIQYDSASIELINDEKIEIVAGKNIPADIIGHSYSSNLEKWGGVGKFRQAMVIQDAQKDERFTRFESTSYIRGWMGIPLISQDKVIGFLNLDSRTPGFFNQEHAATAQAFANQAAIAIEKAKLFELEKKRRASAETLMRAATELTNLLDLPALQNAILEWLYKIAPYDSASILEIEGDFVRVTAAKGLPNPEKTLNQLFSSNNQLCTLINETGQAVIIADCMMDERFENWGDSPQRVRGWMGVPLIARGQVIGYLTLDSLTPNAFTQDDAVIAQTFAHQAATSLENTRLYIETRLRLEELEMVNRVSFALRAAKDSSEMLPILLDEIKSSLETDTAAIWLYDPDRDEIIPQVVSGWLTDLPKITFRPNEGIVGKVFVDGVSHLSEELNRDTNSTSQNLKFYKDNWGGLTVPIGTSSDTIGVILIALPNPRKFESHHVRLVTTLADIAGNAIYRSNLFQQSERQIRRLTTLREIDTAITSSLDLQITLDILTDHLTAKMGASAARILVYNPNSQMLDSFAAGFANPAISRQPISIGDELTSQILLSRTELFIKNIDETDMLSEHLSKEGFKSYFAIPLFSKGATRGVLETFFRYPFTPTSDWKEFVKTLAGQATIAIDNSQLFENLQRTNQELSLAYDTTLEGWGKALELRDEETHGHTRRVTNLTLELARQMGILESEIINIRRGALLHDIGKMGVPDNILHKPGALTNDEKMEMRKHPQYAYDLLYPIAYLRPTLDIPYCHHEWWNGSGYPRGLKGEEIPLSARIFAVIDVWDALLSDRPYRAAWSEEKIMDYILGLSGQQFDPYVVNEFQKLIKARSGLGRDRDEGTRTHEKTKPVKQKKQETKKKR